MCNKAVDTCPSTIQFVTEYNEIQEMSYKAVNTCFFIFDSLPECYNTQETCDKVVSKRPFKLKYCLDRYETQQICGRAVDDCLSALPHEWFITDKVIRKLYEALFANDDIPFLINILLKPFFAGEMGIVSVDLDKIDLDNVNFYEDDPNTFIHVRLLG